MSQRKQVNINKHWVSPSKIACVGRNYIDHIQELGNQVPVEPVIFLKPNSAISDTIKFDHIDEVHYESELCFLIKNGCVAGVGFGLDLTKREVQNTLKKSGLPWERAKAFDGSAIFSHFVDVPVNIENLSMSLTINGDITQHGTFTLMMNKPMELIHHINTFISLIDNDIVMTGTPSGVGKIEKGQEFVGKVFNGNECLLSVTWIVQ